MKTKFWLSALMLSVGFLSLQMQTSAAQDGFWSKLNPFKGRGNGAERKSSVFNGGGAVETEADKATPSTKPSWMLDDGETASSRSSSASESVVSASAEQPVRSPKPRMSLNPLKTLGLVKRPVAAVANTTKKAISKTASWINPFDKKPEPRKQMFQRTNQGYRPQDEVAEPKKSKWRFLLPFDPEPEPDEYYDVNGFLKPGPARYLGAGPS
ncbi:MAG: hypothetical protein AAF483_28625, partial [Planctomycetota bacterium]